ncbi:BfmA/BtgA family mobilization protein [Antarcticibacterium arcticum]|uniref:BfmA/BtgA family mobilization protein n=1 Tax=Antarcticibacterium arcticum TaxID=2585771 RepID=UPI003742D505
MPHEIIGPPVQNLESKIKRRIHVVIAIWKDIEKYQTKPYDNVGGPSRRNLYIKINFFLESIYL